MPETGAFLWSENPGLEYSDGYLNERGVAVVSIQFLSREDGYDALVVRGDGNRPPRTIGTSACRLLTLSVALMRRSPERSLHGNASTAKVVLDL